MTRWARVTTTRSKRPLAATSWEDMKKGSLEGEGQNLPKSKQLEANRLSAKNDTPQAKHKKNKKKKEYLNEDVNGFLEYLRQNPQMVHNGERIATDSQEVREEIAVALKKDSRREGRRLKRQAAKKNAMVCFHCRKPGHGIADCPAALENQDMGTGICYRCGSTEHEITKCKAKVDPALGEFPFAKCFVCGEMGHLSRSCPDNPKGLYADGGCCRLCGSVEHFKKDCPESQNSEEDDLHYIVASETEIMEVEFEFSLLGGLPFPNDKTDKQMLYNFTDQMVTVGRWAMGMSADYEEILDVPEPQKPKTKIPKVVNF